MTCFPVAGSCRNNVPILFFQSQEGSAAVRRIFVRSHSVLEQQGQATCGRVIGHFIPRYPQTTSLRGQSESEAACGGANLEDHSPPHPKYGRAAIPFQAEVSAPLFDRRIVNPRFPELKKLQSCSQAGASIGISLKAASGT